MKPQSGTMLSHYRLVEKIGAGGMGVVYKALDTRLNRHVALKILRPELTADPDRRRRFLREARAAAAVNHPNIATIHQIDEADGVAFIVMELLVGQTLSSRIGGRPLPIPDVFHIASQVAEGMTRAHAARIIHRDLKPDNVIVGPDGHAKILDFGLARVLEESEHSPHPALEETAPEDAVTQDHSFAGRLLGTANYMSPEQARGDAVDARSDIFSFGVILYEMLTGRQPFSERSVAATLAKILESEPDPVGGIRQDLPAELERIVVRCLRKNPAERFEGSGQLALTLKQASRTESPEGAAKAPREGLTGGSAPISSTAIAVFPFSVRGNPDLAYLGPGMVDLLSTKLDGAGELRSVDPHVILCCGIPDGGGAYDPEAAGAAARRFGAGMFVLGGILEISGRLHLDASLYESTGDRRIVAKAAVMGEAGQIFDMVDHLTAELLANRSGGPGTRLGRIAAMTTDSFPALKAYLEGESQMRAMRRAAAADAYRRAVAIDPRFALGWYRLSVAALWSGQSEMALEAARRAVEQNDRLSDRDRDLLEAFEASLRGANDEAERRYRTIVGTHPDDVEAWYQLGELLFHCGPQRGRPIAESRQAWERLLSLDPKHVNGLVHLGIIEASLGDRTALEASVRRVLELSPGGDAAAWIRAFWAFSQDDPAAQEAILRDLRQASDYSVIYAAQFLGAYLGNREAALRLIHLLTEEVRSPEVRAQGHLMRAHLELARGRWNAAQEDLDSAERLHHISGSEYRALLSASLFLEPSPSDLEAARERVRRLEPGSVTPGPQLGAWLAPHEGLHAYLRLYLLGLVSARLGQAEEALGYAEQLERSVVPEHAGALVRDLTGSIRAHAAWAAGRPAEALSILEASRMQARFDLSLWSPFHSQACERYARAELLNQLGRRTEALSWYGSFAENSLYDQIYVAPSHLRRGEIYERLEESQKASEHYARFVELWRECDPQLRPLVEDAEARRAWLGMPGGKAPPTGRGPDMSET